ncbi:MAG: hypothetical protein AAF288_12105 [Planctomycetota bacterium]
MTGLQGVEGDPYEATLRIVWASNDSTYTVEQARERYALDPSIRDDLWTILGSEDYREWWPPTASMFRYVGQEEDLAKIEAYLLGLEGHVGHYGANVAVRLMLSTAEMARRGVPGAMELSRRFTTPGFWGDCRFTLRERRIVAYPAFEVEMTATALETHAYSLDPEFEAVAERAVRAVDPLPAMEWWLASRVSLAHRSLEHWRGEVATGNLGAGWTLGDAPRPPPWWKLREARVAAWIAGAAVLLSLVGSALTTGWMLRPRARRIANTRAAQ